MPPQFRDHFQLKKKWQVFKTDARMAGVRRKRVWFAVSRFARYFPDAVAKARGVKE